MPPSKKIPDGRPLSREKTISGEVKEKEVTALTFTPWPNSNGGGIVMADFHAGESPLGLVMDWSMSRAVVAGVLEGGPAAERPDIDAGLVLIAVNNEELATLDRQHREYVERLLAQRPLTLVFEAPAPLRLVGPGGVVAQCPWQGTGPAQALALAASKGLPQERRGAISTQQRGLNCSKSKWKQAAQGPFTPSRTPQTFFLAHPERIPLSRYGNLETYSPVDDAAGEKPFLYSASAPQLPTIENRMMGTREFTPITAAIEMAQYSTGAKVDRCYAHLSERMLVNGLAKMQGCGPPGKWPLDHADGYICTMVDMYLARSVHDAYEVGFYAKKKERPGNIHICMNKGAPPRNASVILVEEEVVWCDLCGENVAKLTRPGLFWFCRRCKRNGNRFELCVACHAVDVIQGEGKFFGPGLHPHFTRCEHKDCVKYTDLRLAYPTAPQLRRLVCDCCGCLIPFRGPNFCGRGDTVYICPRCPLEHGLRFEMCQTCALTLRQRGHGLRCLENLRDEYM